MKNILYIAFLSFLTCSAGFVFAQDDVYDAPRVKEVKTKKATVQPPAENVEKSVPYYDEENANSRKSEPSIKNEENSRRYHQDDEYSNDFGGGFGYSERIRRFHNPSIQFGFGWNNWYNNYYSPWESYYNNYGWNNWNNFSFTPSWMYTYSDFYNPFWPNTQIIIIQQPWINSWYNTGFYNPWSSWNNWSWNGYNNWGWSGFSPWCSGVIYNNAFPNYGGYYDNNKKNVIYTPRTGGFYNNTNKATNGNYNNYNSPSNNNNAPGVIKNTPSSPVNKWSQPKQQPANPNSTYPDVYKYNRTNPDNRGNDYDRGNTQPPSNNNGWNKGNNNPNNDNSGGIKIGTKPK